MNATSITIDTSQIEALADHWRQAPAIVERELARAITAALFLLQRETQERTPVGVGGGGGLKGSIAVQPLSVSEAGVIGVVGTPLAYAVPVELGTRPHMPPVGPLADWAAAKFGLDAEAARRVGFAVARKIARFGTEGAFMFRDAFDAAEPQIAGMLRDALARIGDLLARRP